MNHKFLLVLLLSLSFLSLKATGKGGEEPVDLVNPFIGTSNFGTTNPGAVCPNGLMSVVPFNVMGSDLNKYDKDARCGQLLTNIIMSFSRAILTSI